MPEDVQKAKININEAMYDEVMQQVSSVSSPPQPEGVKTQPKGEAASSFPIPSPPPVLESTSLPVYASIDKSKKKGNSPQPPDVPKVVATLSNAECKGPQGVGFYDVVKI